MVLLIIATFGIVALYQIAKLKREKRTREIVFFSVLWGLAFVLLMVFNAGMKLPRIVHSFIEFYDWIGVHY